MKYPLNNDFGQFPYFKQDGNFRELGQYLIDDSWFPGCNKVVRFDLFGPEEYPSPKYQQYHANVGGTEAESFEDIAKKHRAEARHRLTQAMKQE